MNYGKYFTVIINAKSGNHTTFMNCLGSLYDLVGSANRIIAVFNPYVPIYNPIFDIEEIRHLDIVKLSKPIKLYVSEILEVDTDYTMIINDTIVFRDNNLYETLNNKHNELLRLKSQIYQIRFSEGINAVSLVSSNEFRATDKFYQYDPYLAYNAKKSETGC